MKAVIVLSILLVFFACQTGEEKKVEETADTLVLETGLTIEPLLQKTDSIQFLYFKNPFGDSLRYTRFYTYHNTNDTSIISTILNQFNKGFIVLTEDKQCRSNGKMFLYGKGNEIKTIYFAIQDNECSYLYYIKNGLFYYFTIDEATTNLLSALKANTIDP